MNNVNPDEGIETSSARAETRVNGGERGGGEPLAVALFKPLGEQRQVALVAGDGERGAVLLNEMLMEGGDTEHGGSFRCLAKF